MGSSRQHLWRRPRSANRLRRLGLRRRRLGSRRKRPPGFAWCQPAKDRTHGRSRAVKRGRIDAEPAPLLTFPRHPGATSCGRMNVPPCLWKGRFMRRVLFTGLLCIAGVLAAASPQAQQSSAEPAQSQTPFHSVTHAVSIYATIVDSTGRLVTDISRDEFEIYDNGKKQNLTLFDNGIQPITIVIMLDRSGSMVKNFDLERDAAERFVADLLPTDKARLGSFSNRIEIDPPSFTSNKDDLIRI